MKYACVTVSVSHSDVDNIFHYSIPEAIKDKIRVGMRINVPFGRYNKIIEGYVTGLTDTADIDDKKIKIAEKLMENK